MDTLVKISLTLIAFLKSYVGNTNSHLLNRLLSQDTRKLNKEILNADIYSDTHNTSFL